MARAIKLTSNFGDLKKGTVVANCSNQLAQKLVHRRKVAEFVDENEADAPAKQVAGANKAAEKIVKDAEAKAKGIVKDAEAKAKEIVDGAELQK